MRAFNGALICIGVASSATGGWGFSMEGPGLGAELEHADSSKPKASRYLLLLVKSLNY